MKKQDFIDFIKAAYALKVAQPENEERAKELFSESNKKYHQAIGNEITLHDVIADEIPQWKEFLTEEELNQINQ